MRIDIVFLVLTMASSVCNAQWMRTSLDSIDVTCFATSGTNLYVGGGGYPYISYPNRGVFRSTDDGASWNGAGLTEFGVYSLAVVGTNLFAGAGDTRVFRSTNDGTTWDSLNLPPLSCTSCTVSALAVSGTTLFAGIDYGWRIPLDSTRYGVWLSTNNGTSWTAANAGLAWKHVLVLAVSGMNLFAGTEGAGVFLSTDNGTSWTTRNSGLPTDATVRALAVSGTNLFAGILGSGVFLSTNNGTNWTPVNSGLTNTAVLTLVSSGTNLFAGTWRGGGVFLSTNNGANWSPVNSGLTDTVVTALGVSSTNLFAGTSYADMGGRATGVWRRPLSEMITNVESKLQLPTRFTLEQNFPNPFNPSSIIRYGLPHSSFVSLTVYNTLGQQVAQLVNEQQQAGYHDAVFRGDGLPSGMYFYQLQAGSSVDIKKLILLK